MEKKKILDVLGWLIMIVLISGATGLVCASIWYEKGVADTKGKHLLNTEAGIAYKVVLAGVPVGKNDGFYDLGGKASVLSNQCLYEIQERSVVISPNGEANEVKIKK